MPTIQQLFSIWESQFEFFGGAGLPKQSYGSSLESSFTSEMQKEVPIVPQHDNVEEDGEEIGEIIWDEQEQDLRFKTID